MRMLPPGRTAVLAAAVFVSLCIAAILLHFSVRSIVHGHPWYLVGLAALAAAGLVVGAIDGRGSAVRPAESTVVGSVVGTLVGTIVGLVWPVMLWLAACFLLFAYVLIPWGQLSVED